jgi:hypothetical protein
MRRYEKQKDLINAHLAEGELITYNNKVCRVTIARGGPLNAPKLSVVLTPLTQITITEDTEIIVST